MSPRNAASSSAKTNELNTIAAIASVVIARRPAVDVTVTSEVANVVSERVLPGLRLEQRVRHHDQGRADAAQHPG